MNFDFDAQYPFRRRKMEIPVPKKSVRTYIDAYDALIRGREVHLTVNPHLVNAPSLILTPWQYGHRYNLPVVHDVIDEFRELHRPYAGVKWEIIPIKNQTQVQLQNDRGQLLAGTTGILVQQGSYDGDEDPALYFQMNFHEGKFMKAKWADLWGDWHLVDVGQRDNCLSGVEVDMRKVVDILTQAKSGDRLSAAAFDWFTFHWPVQNQRPWWSITLNELKSCKHYKAWEREIFERHLSNIFKSS